MSESASGFAAIISVFPFLLIFLLAAVLAGFIFGLVLFINGLKSKGAELTNAGHALKIVKIIIGLILISIALFLVIYTTLGMVALYNRGGFYANRSSSNPQPSSEQLSAVITYLKVIL